MQADRITAAEVKALEGRGVPIGFLDSRNPVAWSESPMKLRGAVRVPADEVDQHLNEIPRDKLMVAYCT